MDGQYNSYGLDIRPKSIRVEFVNGKWGFVMRKALKGGEGSFQITPNQQYFILKGWAVNMILSKGVKSPITVDMLTEVQG